MTRRDYLYTVLNKEAAEVQQAVSKILRFGERAYDPDDEYKMENAYLLLVEIEHFKAAIAMLEENGFLDTLSDEVKLTIQKTKKEKVNEYLERHLKEQAFINEHLPDHPNYQGS